MDIVPPKKMLAARQDKKAGKQIFDRKSIIRYINANLSTSLNRT